MKRMTRMQFLHPAVLATGALLWAALLWRIFV
jgi:hypothetical protein